MAAFPTRVARVLATLIALAGVSLVLAACGSGDDGGSTTDAATPAAEAGAFPVELTGAFGTAKIEAAPKRVVTLGWSDQDVTLALGVKPVGVYDIGDDFPQGVGPWGARQIGDSKPVKLSLADGIPFEKIAALRPDAIIAVQSGVTQADYDKLSKIAPTVTFLKGRGIYVTPWPEQTELIGRALGQEAKAKQLVEQTRAALVEAKADHPELRGKTFSYTARQDGGTVGVYLPSDLRLKFLEDVGMKLSKGQIAATRKVNNGVYASISYERLSELDADVLVSWFNSPADRKTFTGRAGFRDLGVIERGGFVPLDLIQAQAQGAPTVLSIPWAIEHVLPLVQDGVAGKGPKS